MKKNIFALGLICAAAFTLTNCTKELEVSSKSDVPFEIFAETGTKTTTNGSITEWASGDKLSVFYAEAGTTKYSGNTQFTYEASSKTTFKTTVAVDLSGAATYDWYAIYPYNKNIGSPNNNDKGYITVGGTTQTQIGNDSMDHLAGDACPLYGVVKSVANTEKPTFTMHHLTSVIEVLVENNSGADLTVNEVTFTASNESDIAGTYYVNFADPKAGIGYTGSGSSYVSNTATLNVTGGSAISDGNSAKFYIAVKPFTADEGEVLKISVNGIEKTVTIPVGKTVEFKAGKIMTVDFSMETAVETPKYIFQTAKSTSNTAYANNYDVTIDELAWSVPGNQNNTGFVRIGGKSLDGVNRVIYSKTAMAYGINKVVLSTNGISDDNLTVNSITMKVYSSAADAAAGKATPVASLTNTDKDWAVSTEKEITFVNTSGTPWINAFYRFEFNVSNAKAKNYGLDLKKIEFYE